MHRNADVGLTRGPVVPWFAGRGFVVSAGLAVATAGPRGSEAARRGRPPKGPGWRSGGPPMSKAVSRVELRAPRPAHADAPPCDNDSASPDYRLFRAIPHRIGGISGEPSVGRYAGAGDARACPRRDQGGGR